jgi:2-keto-4-pentenoate hydratase/2-oxohepta-3-ene-1,7-dioic acid hydratase in catechol pathway
VTADEVPDPLALGVRLFLNGQVMQEGNTSNMIFPPARLIAYISQVVTLAPGDLIFTGTPAGVGVARKPPVWLKAGDTVEITIDHVGLLRNPVVQG